MSNLYTNNQLYYALTINSVYSEIKQPKGLESALNRMPRDKDWYGFMYEFIEDKIQLLFDFEPNGGGELLYKAYKDTGFDTNVIFEFGYIIGNYRKQLYAATLNMNDYGRDISGSKGSIEKRPFQAKLNSRENSLVTVNNFLNFDKGRLTPISTWQLRMHSKDIKKQTLTANISGTSTDVSIPTASTVDFWIQPNTENNNKSELQELQSMPVGIIDENTNGHPLDIRLFQFKATEDGLLNIQFSGSIWLYMKNINGFEYQYQPVVIVQKDGYQNGNYVVKSTTYDLDPANTRHMSAATPDRGAFVANPVPSYIMPSVTGPTRQQIFGFNHQWNSSFAKIPVNVDDQVYIMFQAVLISVVAAPVVGIQVDEYFNTLEIVQDTFSPATVANGYRIFDLIQHGIEACTGSAARLKSEYFSPGGAGYNYLITHGYLLRNFLNAPMKFELNKLLASLQSIFAIGVGYQTIDKQDFVVIEDIPKFFRDRVIHIFREAQDWEEGNNAAVVYNSASLGYSKVEQDQYGLMDEFNTEGDYLLPIKTNQNNLIKKSDIIGSGLTMEGQRRAQFSRQPSTSHSFDDDLFICATMDVLKWDFADAFFYGYPASDRITTPISLGLSVGDKFKTTGGILNANIEYTVTAKVQGYPDAAGGDSYVISPNPAPETVIGGSLQLIPPAPNYVYAERNNAFSILANVIDPATVYNARLSCKHILYNWSPVLAVGLYFLKGGDYDTSSIFTTHVKNNDKLITAFNASEPFKGFAGLQLLTEKDNEAVADFNKGQAIYTPERATFSVFIDWDVYLKIQSGLRGELDDETKDWGGIVAPDLDGDFWFCHIMNIEHNPVTQIATFEVQKVKRYYPILNS